MATRHTEARRQPVDYPSLDVARFGSGVGVQKILILTRRPQLHRPGDPRCRRVHMSKEARCSKIACSGQYRRRQCVQRLRPAQSKVRQARWQLRRRCIRSGRHQADGSIQLFGIDGEGCVHVSRVGHPRIVGSTPPPLSQL